jgi:crotonobetaine/carnitine-CoA ligase
MMREYLGRPDATAETIGPDGWLRTGDRARRDEDGVHYFLGRKKELIRRGGENIAPFEVEAVLRLHDAVVDAAVVPVADALRGEEVKAYVELKPGAAVAPPQLVDFCAERLARHKVPRYVELRAEPFPRTPSQRIRKSELMVDGVHATASAWDREEDRG